MNKIILQIMKSCHPVKSLLRLGLDLYLFIYSRACVLARPIEVETNETTIEVVITGHTPLVCVSRVVNR